MANPTGRNQYSGGKGRKKGAPKMGAAAAKFKKAGIAGRLSSPPKKKRGPKDSFYGGKKYLSN